MDYLYRCSSDYYIPSFLACMGSLVKEEGARISPDGRRGADQISISGSDSDVYSFNYSSVSSFSSSSCAATRREEGRTIAGFREDAGGGGWAGGGGSHREASERKEYTSESDPDIEI